MKENIIFSNRVFKQKNKQMYTILGHRKVLRIWCERVCMHVPWEIDSSWEIGVPKKSALEMAVFRGGSAREPDLM